MKLVKSSRRRFLVPKSQVTRGVNRYRTRGRRIKYRNTGLLNRAITKVLDKRTETKQISNTSDTYFNSGINSVSEFYSMIPSIVQGYGDSQRIGQKVRMKYLKIKGVISYETAIGTTNNLPIYTDIFILQDKIQKSQNSAPHDYKILNNSGISTAYNGDALIAQYPVNTEEFRLVKRIRRRLAFNYAPGSTSSTLTEPYSRLQATFTIKIPVYNQQLDYESSTANLPQNTNFWLTAGFFQYTSTTQTAAPMRVQWVSTLYYKDD